MSAPGPRRKLRLPQWGRRRAARSRDGESGWRWFRRELRILFKRYSLLRDVVGALLIVGIVTGGIAGATGGVWPPVLAVESGSMMHPTFETAYGRIGTIDVGDLVFVRAVDPDEVRLWVDGGEIRYGRPGSVIAYKQDGDSGPLNLTILHRAITFVEVVREPGEPPTYEMRWVDGETLTFGASGIYFPPLGFDETRGFTRANGYRPGYSGFITKGDNPGSNPAADQALGISKLVHPDWVVGEIYGELPWLGLAKLTLQSGKTNPQVPGWERIGNAFAPIELWTCFFVVLTVVILLPFAVGTWRLWREHEERHRVRRRAPPPEEREPPPPPPPPAAPPQPPARRAPATFEVVTRPRREP